MENINMGGQISSADFGQYSPGVYINIILQKEFQCIKVIIYVIRETHKF